MEEAVAVPTPVLTAAALEPYLKGCGYTESRLARNYTFGTSTLPLAGFYGRPWDVRSACLAVAETNDDGRSAAAGCLELGAPTALVCHGDSLEWWRLSADGPSESRSINAAYLEGFFREHKDDLSPEAIYTAKMRRPTRTAKQMWFVDLGLMPVTERRTGKTLHRWVEVVIQDLASRLGGRLRTKKNFADLYKTVFWLLAAKLLHEKDVNNFKRIDLVNIDDVFRRVGKHYADIDDLPPGGKAWRPAIDEAAHTVSNWSHLGNLSAESLAYLYETALIDAKPKGKAAKSATGGRDIRKELGIHSTPPVLVDHMLAQLWPMIEWHSPDDRRVFEPACGHAGFLVAAMRWLRDFSGMDDSEDRHRYLRDRLYGVEVDPFARELAKLQLTLADVPHGNTWRIDDADMFMPDVLKTATSACTLLLANPPYESFAPKEKAAYSRAQSPVTAITKVVEVLKRSLPHLPPGGVFGVVVPQGVLHDKESQCVREFLLQECALAEISVFADNLFERGDHEVAVLMGQRRHQTMEPGALMYRRVREGDMEAFKTQLAFSSERNVPQCRFLDSEIADLRLRDLDEVWQFLADSPQLSDLAVVRQGASLHPGLQKEVEHRAEKKRPGAAVPAIVCRFREFDICELPTVSWLHREKRDVLHWRGGTFFDRSQVLLNYAPQSRGPWRLKAFCDDRGCATTNKYITVRPIQRSFPILSLWSVLNSPIANAFAYCGSLKRHTLDGLLGSLPLPSLNSTAYDALVAAATRYRRTASRVPRLMENEQREDATHQALLDMDAAVLRAYDLPPRLERQLLDLFQGVERKGVGCTFRGYYPRGFSSFLPLHLLISDRFQRAAADRTANRFMPGESDHVRTALHIASTGFDEE